MTATASHWSRLVGLVLIVAAFVVALGKRA